MRQSAVLIVFYFLLVSLMNTAVSQPLLDPQETKFKSFSIGTYGRVGANWSFDVQGALARTFNLN